MSAEVKWIKIMTDIFDDTKIKLIESMPEADSIIVIWFKLLCLAGQQNNDGVFILNGRIAFTDEMFSAIFRRPLNTVRLALSTFQQYGMIEIIDNIVTIPNWNKHQNLDGYEKKKQRDRLYAQKRREHQKLMIEGSAEPEFLTIEEDEESRSMSDDSSAYGRSEVAVSDIEEDIDIYSDSNNEEVPQKPIKKRKRPDTKPDVKEEDALFKIPLSDGSLYFVGKQEIDQYRTLYPDVDIEQQYRNMIGWCANNPRKTRSGVGRFINGWLARTQNSIGPRRNEQTQRSNGGRTANTRYVPVPDYLPDDDSNPYAR